jgi:hypothetical protein
MHFGNYETVQSMNIIIRCKPTVIHMPRSSIFHKLYDVRHFKKFQIDKYALHNLMSILERNRKRHGQYQTLTNTMNPQTIISVHVYSFLHCPNPMW